MYAYAACLQAMNHLAPFSFISFCIAYICMVMLPTTCKNDYNTILARSMAMNCHVPFSFRSFLKARIADAAARASDVSDTPPPPTLPMS